MDSMPLFMFGKGPKEESKQFESDMKRPQVAIKEEMKSISSGDDDSGHITLQKPNSSPKEMIDQLVMKQESNIDSSFKNSDRHHSSKLPVLSNGIQMKKSKSKVHPKPQKMSRYQKRWSSMMNVFNNESNKESSNHTLQNIPENKSEYSIYLSPGPIRQKALVLLSSQGKGDSRSSAQD